MLTTDYDTSKFRKVPGLSKSGLTDQQREVYFWPFSSDVREGNQAGNFRVMPSHVEGTVLRAEFNNVVRL